MSTPKPHGTSVAIYTKSVLEIIYDVYVLGFNMSYVWCCPTKSVLLPFFKRNFSSRHLDVGVGTGYFPAKALDELKDTRPQESLVLVDANTNTLRVAKEHALAVAPDAKVEVYEGDIKKPLPAAVQDKTFDSVSMYNLFHCVPGSDKLDSLQNFADVLSDDGVLSGCTVLGASYSVSWLSTLVLKIYNRWGIMHNLNDNEKQYDIALRASFDDVEINIIGMVLIFEARKPKRI